MIKELNFGERSIRCRNAHESSIGMLECPNGHAAHGRVYIALTADTTAPAGRSWYGSYSPQQAREIAALMIEAADQIDGGSGLQ